MIYGIKTVVKYALGIDIAGRNFAVYPDDTFVVSYPRSGNTWTRFLIANLVHPDKDVSFANIEKLIPDTSSQSNHALKTTPRPRIIKTHEYFDHRYPKTIYIVRDPRDVTASVLQFPWGPNNAVVAANDWNRLITKARLVGAKLGPDRYLEFRYEDLLTKPGETMAALLQFVAGSVDQVKVAEFEQETAVNPLRRNFGNWKKGLTPNQGKKG